MMFRLIRKILQANYSYNKLSLEDLIYKYKII